MSAREMGGQLVLSSMHSGQACQWPCRYGGTTLPFS